ncbi:MAG: hypothetical protein JWM86_1026 [Thermoleophilia bacterium]|nr:hypothetical protein [Thermoleophilia bacterium]
MLVVAALALPSAAAAHSRSLGEGDAPLDPAAAASLEREQSEALAALPRETSAGACRSTVDVDGLGRACRTEDGLFRVVLPNGDTLATHGGDAPAADSSNVAAAHLPDTQAAINGADVSDIECVTGASESRIEILYAYPANKANRSAALTNPLRQQIYAASAFVDAESQALDPDAGRRLRIGCTGGVPTINVAQVRAVGAGESFSNIVADLVAQGYPATNWDSTSPRRFIVFYDAPHESGAAGIGTLWNDDDLAADNLNNRGGRYAVEFDWSGSHLPHWDIMLHEMGHNMGATSNNAPDASLAGHCIDGLDVMCYNDGGSGGTYTTSSCSVERFDCGGDTYFNPKPAPGSYLDTHWNIASTLNAFIEPRFAGWSDGGVPDTTAPTVPAALATTNVGNTSITIQWSPSTDARSEVHYRAFVDRSVNGSYVLDATHAPLTAVSLNVTGLTAGTPYRFRVVAYDLAGNTSGEAVVLASTLNGPPTAPGAITLAVAENSSFDATWLAGSAGAGVRGYEIGLQAGDGSFLTLGEIAGRQVRVTQLEPGATYHLRVRTVAVGGVVSQWRVSDALTMPGTLLGGGGGGDATLAAPEVTLTRRGFTGVTAAWTADPSAVSWDVTVLEGTGTVVKRLADLDITTAAINGLVPGHTYRVQVVATSATGVASPAGSSVVAMPRDRVAPGAVRLGRRAVVRTSVRITWAAASDNAGIARYEIERRVGSRWVRSRAGSTARAAVIGNVSARTATAMRIRAVDVGGNNGAWTAFAIRR